MRSLFVKKCKLENVSVAVAAVLVFGVLWVLGTVLYQARIDEKRRLCGHLASMVEPQNRAEFEKICNKR